MAKRIRLTATFPAPPSLVYRAWITGKEHAKMTGAAATSAARVGGRFTAWDGYISGKHLELTEGARVVQAWRTTEFADEQPDSRLEVQFEPARGGTRLTLLHSEIPPGDEAKYEAGWKEFYLEPMRRYFASLVPTNPGSGKGRRVKRTAKRAAPKAP